MKEIIIISDITYSSKKYELVLRNLDNFLFGLSKIKLTKKEESMRSKIHGKLYKLLHECNLELWERDL